MAITLLRKLTRKSTLKFGQYADLSIQEAIHRHYVRYLRWVYYNCDMITFMDDILDEILVPPHCRIEKPGKYPIMNEALNELYDMRISGFSKLKSKKRASRIRRKASEKTIRKQNFSKGMLKSMGQSRRNPT